MDNLAIRPGSDMTETVKGKRVAITGGASGIGFATAAEMIKAGAKVVLIDRDQEALKTAKNKLGENAFIVEQDLLDSKGVSNLLPNILNKVGTLDVFHANAGAYIGGPIAEGDPDQWDTILHLNVNAVFRSIRSVLPYMIERQEGDIIATGSIAGVVPVMSEPIYTATKHALQAFMHTTRRQVSQHGVRMGSVLPGTALTPLTDSWPEEKRARHEAANSIMDPGDVAKAVHFMLTRPKGVVVRDLVIMANTVDH